MAPNTSLDVAAARLVARLRLVVLTALAIAVPLAAGEEAHRGFQLVVALAAVPAAGVLAGSVERLRAPAASFVGLAIDLGVILAAQRAFPSSATAMLVVLLSVVLIGAYTGGRVVGLIAGAAGVAVALAGQTVGNDDVGSGLLILFVVGMTVALVVVERSATERSRAESRTVHYAGRADAVLERVAEAVVVTDPAGGIVAHNPAAARFVAASRNGPPRCGSALRLRVGGREVSCDQGCMLAAVTGPAGGPVELDVTCTAADGTEVPVLASVAPVTGADGTVEEYVHSLRDITRLKQAEDAKNIFLATATHELKTPLTVISGFLETIDRTELDADARRDAVAIMRRRASELSEIIERILLASRIDSGQVRLTLEAFDALVVAAERVGDLHAATRRDITLDTAPHVATAWGDAGALAIVVDHLIDNALKYSTGPVVVRVRSDDHAVVVEVGDEGMGMDAQEVERCFDKFWQADSGDTRRTSGTGIGLYIVRALVEAMGGRVGVQSAPGAGSTFAVHLRRSDRLRGGDDQRGGGTADTSLPEAPVNEPSIVREFMRQIGIPSPRPTP